MDRVRSVPLPLPRISTHFRRTWRDLPSGLIMLLPSLVIFAVFVFFPLAYTLYLSLLRWDMISPTQTMVGLKNFEKLLRDPLFWKVVQNTVIFSAAVVFCALVLGLALALLLNRPLVGRGVYRAILFSPYVTTPAAMALVWLWIFDPHYGLLNAALRLLAIKGPEWLASTQWALPAIIIMTIWRFTGYNMVIFLAGLQNIPYELREAARMDGANAWVELWRITLPLLSPTTFFIVTTSIISTFQVFETVYVMTQGGPVNSTNVLVFYLYQNAFQFFEAGYASAIATVFFIIILAVTAVQVTLSGRWVHY